MQTECAIRESWNDFVPLSSIRQGKSAGCARRIFFVLFLLAVALVSAPARAATVWIDTDISIGSPFREVDDAFAIFLAARTPTLRIAGVSTTYGNAPLSATTKAAEDLLGRIARDRGEKMPAVCPGARSAKDLGVETAGTRALAEALQKDRRVVYLALGPLTNLATFIALHPDLAPRVERVIFIGGKIEGTSLRFGSKHPLTVHDANVFQDPEAAGQVLRSNLPLVFIPIPVAAEFTLDKSDLKAIARNGEAGKFLEQHSRLWLWFWTKWVGLKGGAIFDAAAIVAAAQPKESILDRAYATVDSSGVVRLSRQRTPSARAVLFCPRFAARNLEFARERLIAAPTSPHSTKIIPADKPLQP